MPRRDIYAGVARSAGIHHPSSRKMKPLQTIFRKMRRRFRCGLLACILLLLQLVLADRGFALDPAKSIFQFNCQNWTPQNGLPADKINTITQSKDGYLWLGTQNGLVRFDGLEFKVIPIDLPQARGQDVSKVVAARDGQIRFAINLGGFGSYDGQKFSAIGDDRWAQPDTSGLTILETRDGAIWTGEENRTGRWAKGKPGESFLDQTNINHVKSLCEDASGRLWLGTSEHGVYYWANGKFVQIPDEPLKKQIIFDLAADSENRLWVGTQSGLRCYVNGKLQEIPAFNTEVRALLVDRHGVLWIGTTGQGLVRYANGEFVSLRRADGLGSDLVTSLFEDAEGSLWVGTRDGLNQLSDLKFPIYSEKEGLGGGG